MTPGASVVTRLAAFAVRIVELVERQLKRLRELILYRGATSAADG